MPCNTCQPKKSCCCPLRGPPGPQGLAGSTGPEGESGVSGLSSYGYIYNLDAQTVAISAPVLFDTNGPMVGITHTVSSETITVVSAGTYVITFSVSGTESSQFALAVNGVPNTSTIYASGAGTQQNNGQTILTLGAGAELTLINHLSAAAVGLATPIGGTAGSINASVLIQRVA